jgi:FkbM family methyltransferase
MPEIKAILARIRKLQRKERDKFLNDISGLIHVGANTGQERYLYAAYGLRVLWIEPIPEVFEKLVANLKAFPEQRAVKDLVTDRDGEEYKFHISNNSGLSSSILGLKQHKDIWPDVDYTESIPLTSTTLNSLLQREQIDPAEYQALIMDTQGSELLVLHGAVPVLKNFQYIKTEVADFEAYTGCCQLADINAFMTEHGYRESFRRMFASRTGGGSYYDITYGK